MLNVNSVLALVFSAAIGLATCANCACRVLADEVGPLGEQGLSDAEVDSIRKIIVSWTNAFVKGNLELWDSYWAKGSVLMPPGRDVITGQSKRNALAKTSPYDNIKTATFSDWAIVGRDDLAVVSNNIEIQSKSGGPPAVSKQLIILRQREKGKWLVQAVMFNPMD
jgi:ketosteroid isomerase-like protein